MATSKIKAQATVETLAPGAKLIRQGNVRTLTYTAYSVSNGISIPAGDRPSEDCTAVIMRQASSAYVCIGLVKVRTTGGVQNFVAGYYNHGNGLTPCGGGDVLDGQITWVVG